MNEKEVIGNLEEYEDPYLYDAEFGGYQSDFDLFVNLILKGNVLDLLERMALMSVLRKAER